MTQKGVYLEEYPKVKNFLIQFFNSSVIFVSSRRFLSISCLRTHFESIRLNFNSLLFVFSSYQFKYLDKEEFKDLKYLRRLHLDGNQLSVIVDYLFQRQKNLLFLGE